MFGVQAAKASGIRKLVVGQFELCLYWRRYKRNRLIASTEAVIEQAAHTRVVLLMGVATSERSQMP